MYEVDREAEIIKYLPLVERVVQRLSIKTADYESGDLYNIGVIGLMDALRKFDPSKKVPFESYAVIRIKGAIIDEVRKHAKISRYKMAAVNQFYQARQELEQSLKREATDTEICKQLGINQSQLADIYEFALLSQRLFGRYLVCLPRRRHDDKGYGSGSCRECRRYLSR